MKTLNKILLASALSIPLSIIALPPLRREEFKPQYYCLDVQDSIEKYCFWNFSGGSASDIDVITIGDSPGKLLFYAPKLEARIEEKIKKRFPDNKNSAIMKRSELTEYVDQIVIHRDYRD